MGARFYELLTSKDTEYEDYQDYQDIAEFGADKYPLRMNKELFLKSKLFVCPKHNGKLVSLNECEECELKDKCAIKDMPIDRLARYLPEEQKHIIYDTVLPSTLVTPIKESSRILMWEQVIRQMSPNSSVLDLGCGTGRIARVLYESGFKGKYLGVEWSEPRTKIAK